MYCCDLTIMDMLKGKNKKQSQDWQDGFCSVKNAQYATRFEDALESLQFRLANLEQNLNLVNEHHDKQKAVLNILTEIKNTKEEIRRNQTNLQCSKNMPAVRSQKAPAAIADHHIWNDCWYDTKQNVYVTHNQYFKEIPDSRTREIQIQYEKENNDDGIAVEEDRVKFFFGYPSLKLTYDDNTSVNFLLPTLTDDMLTKEILKARLVPESAEEAIMYRTTSERWIGIGDGQLRLTEKEYELGKETGRYYHEPMELVKMLYNRN